MSDQDSKDVSVTPDALSKPDGFGLLLSLPLSPERITEARAAVIESGQRIAAEFGDLDRRERVRLTTLFRRQLIPPGKPGRRRSKEITAAYSDWKSGMRGLALYRKHLPGFDRMNHYKRKVKTTALMDAIRSRERRV